MVEFSVFKKIDILQLSSMVFDSELNFSSQGQLKTLLTNVVMLCCTSCGDPEDPDKWSLDVRLATSENVVEALIDILRWNCSLIFRDSQSLVVGAPSCLLRTTRVVNIVWASTSGDGTRSVCRTMFIRICQKIKNSHR